MDKQQGWEVIKKDNIPENRKPSNTKGSSNKAKMNF
jgi:hypothetical protein